jgi:hypothetical protein
MAKHLQERSRLQAELREADHRLVEATANDVMVATLRKQSPLVAGRMPAKSGQDAFPPSPSQAACSFIC